MNSHNNIDQALHWWLHKHFDLEMQTKDRIAKYYHRDANDWKMLYDMTRSDEVQQYSILSKRFYFLRQSLECVLKAIAMRSPKMTADDAYLRVGSSKHWLWGIYNDIKTELQSEGTLLSTEWEARLLELDKVRVGVRYDMDFKLGLTNEIDEGYGYKQWPYSQMVSNPKFHQGMIVDIRSIAKMYHHILEKHFRWHEWCSLADHSKIDDNIRRITKYKPLRKVSIPIA
jgi:hypothetical protein